MRNARETTETASAANHLDNYSRAVRMRLRSGIVDAANRFAIYVARCWLPALVTITEPLRTVTECNHNRVSSRDRAN